MVVGDRRVLLRKVERLQQKIARKASKNARSAEALKPLYIETVALLQSENSTNHGATQEIKEF